MSIASTISESTIPLRKRSDLQIRPQRIGVARRWAIKDPVKLEYYHLGSHELFLLEQLDGRISLSELKRRFDAKFAPSKVSLSELTGFLKRLFDFGLTISDSDGQGPLLYQRARRQWRRGMLAQLSNPLAIRFRGVDASWLLKQLRPVSQLLFHPLMIALASAMILGVVTFAWANQNQIIGELGATTDVVTTSSAMQLAVVLGVVKVVHELGHGLACRHHGGECSEIGAMLLVGAPCLYCNVTDAWMFTSKWSRIAVSLAGIYMELLITIVAFGIWLVTLPGLLHTLSWNVVVVCSISTLIFNANPLMRYDGYYVLADLVDIPNLAEQSRDAIWGRLERWLTGAPSTNSTPDGSPVFLMTYGLLSTAYRLGVSGVIVWVACQWLHEHRVGSLGTVIALVVACSLFAPWGFAMLRFTQHVQSGVALPWRRWGAMLLLLATGCIAVTTIPLPYSVRAPAVVDATDASYLRSPYDGELKHSLPEGTIVRQGQVVFSIENLDLRRELQQAEGEMRTLQNQLKSFERRLSSDPDAANRVTTALAAFHAAEQRWRSIQLKQERLNVVAPRDGVVLPPPLIAVPNDNDELPRWSGTPLAKENRGCYLLAGELVCLIGQPQRVSALVPVEAHDVERVEVGAPVELRLNHCPGTTVLGRVREIAQEPMPTGGIDVVNSVDRSAGPDRPRHPLVSSTHYVRVEFRQELAGVYHGSLGVAKLHARPSTLANRILRYARQNLKFRYD